MKKNLLLIVLCLLSAISITSCSKDEEGRSTTGLDINGTTYKVVCDVSEYTSDGYFYFSFNFPESTLDKIVPPLSFSGYFLALDLVNLKVGSDLLDNHKTSKTNKYGVLDYNAEGEYVDDECVSGKVILLEKELPKIKLRFNNIAFMIKGQKYVINGESAMDLKKKI